MPRSGLSQRHKEYTVECVYPALFSSLFITKATGALASTPTDPGGEGSEGPELLYYLRPVEHFKSVALYT